MRNGAGNIISVLELINQAKQTTGAGKQHTLKSSAVDIFKVDEHFSMV